MAWIAAYFGGLLVILLLAIIGAMTEGLSTEKNVFLGLTLIAVLWPITLPLVIMNIKNLVG